MSEQSLSQMVEIATGGKSRFEKAPRGWSMSQLVEIATEGESRFEKAPGGWYPLIVLGWYLL